MDAPPQPALRNFPIFDIHLLRDLSLERLEPIYHSLISFHNFIASHEKDNHAIYEYSRLLSSSIKQIDIERFSHLDEDLRREGLLLLGGLLESRRMARYCEPRLNNFPTHAPSCFSSPASTSTSSLPAPTAPKKCPCHPPPQQFSPEENAKLRKEAADLVMKKLEEGPDPLARNPTPSPPTGRVVTKMTARRLFFAPRQVAKKTTSAPSLPSLPPTTCLPSSLLCDEPEAIDSSSSEDEVLTQASFKKERKN